jgi:transposase-like protein
MPEPDLPRLSSADLTERFGADEAALRRYRMLAALLREGRPPGEVARTFGISRESLRRLREAYRTGGLAALRSRKTGGGHFARSSPLARALRHELAVNPGLSAGALWQRVQARLRAEGTDAPRSTFYRLLARLRDDDETPAAGTASLRLLREALAALPEDPPVALGRSELAALVVPDEADLNQRGRRLQAAMRAAIERLRPTDEAGPVLNDLRWRHYLIVAGEYEAGEDRAALQDTLALSASTYSRAKREALERLLALLPAAVESLPPPPPSAAIFAPQTPSGADFDAELELYATTLRRDGIALVHGPDDEETADLAATLATRLQARGQTIVWHRARPADADFSPGHRLLRVLAAALAHDGERELWEILAAPAATPEIWHFDILAHALAGRHWTVVVADTHVLEGDAADQALDVLVTAREQRDIRLVLAGRTLPSWASPDVWPPLALPDETAARTALLARIAARTARPHDLAPDAIRERAAELIAALTPDRLRELSPDQRAELLSAIAPLAEALSALQGEGLRVKG